MIVATTKPGASLAKVEAAIDEELARFLKDGPTADELRRVQVQFEAGFVRGIERIGGFGGKSDVLAHNFVFTRDPAYYRTMLKDVREATPRHLLDAARAWLSDGQFVLEIHPFPDFTTAKSDVDPQPPPGARAEARGTLSRVPARHACQPA